MSRIVDRAWFFSQRAGHRDSRCWSPLLVHFGSIREALSSKISVCYIERATIPPSPPTSFNNSSVYRKPSTSKSVWHMKMCGVALELIQPEKPSQSSYAERSNRSYRHEVRDLNVFNSLIEARWASIITTSTAS